MTQSEPPSDLDKSTAAQVDTRATDSWYNIFDDYLQAKQQERAY